MKKLDRAQKILVEKHARQIIASHLPSQLRLTLNYPDNTLPCQLPKMTSLRKNKNKKS
jgi:hypothetical protein